MRLRNLKGWIWTAGIHALILSLSIASADEAKVRLHHHIPAAVKRFKHLGRTNPNSKIQLSVPLKLTKDKDLAAFIEKVQTPGDALYGRFLTPTEFADQFGVSAEDYNSVADYLAAHGLQVTKRHANRLLLNIEGSAAQVEAAFSVELHDYNDGVDTLRAPTSEPLLADSIATKIHGLLGLNNFDRPQPFVVPGHGPGVGGLTPADIRKAYHFDQLSLDGQGQTLALVEFDGYLASDISAYTGMFSITNPAPLQNILVGGFDGSPGGQSGQGEVTLDIQMVLAVAPHLDKILVYEGAPGSVYVDVLTRIANDNLARQVSMSWGTPEDKSDPNAIQAENTILMQMAAQGQTVFIASGDSGAYAGKTTKLVIANPGGQPYATSVGGTKMTVASDGSYISETSWGNAAHQAGGGGGISALLSIPSWQVGLATAANLGSTTHRMIPDVALDASGETGYFYYIRGANATAGGTSFASPIWAAFGALINEQRVINGLPSLGFANPKIYQLAKSSLYSSLFNDISDGSTNLFYPATVGYDLTTGWGSPKVPALLNALAGTVLPPMVPLTFTATLQNP